MQRFQVKSATARLLPVRIEAEHGCIDCESVKRLIAMGRSKVAEGRLNDIKQSVNVKHCDSVYQTELSNSGVSNVWRRRKTRDALPVGSRLNDNSY